ncbi:MAG: hypothetical protein M3326_05490 [Actinomycetota bacterium]|nr:hypothetical protein [Actinomycetota bacterium]
MRLPGLWRARLAVGMTAVAAPAIVPGGQRPSDWLALAIEATRGWDRAAG